MLLVYMQWFWGIYLGSERSQSGWKWFLGIISAAESNSLPVKQDPGIISLSLLSRTLQDALHSTHFRSSLFQRKRLHLELDQEASISLLIFQAKSLPCLYHDLKAGLLGVAHLKQESAP